MRRRFWRDVTLIVLAHVGVVVALLRWAGETKAASAAEITWLSGGAEAGTEESSAPEPTASAPQPAETISEAKSDIVLPSPRPLAATTPSVTPRPTPKKVTAKPAPAPKATPKKKATPKATVTPAKKTNIANAQRKEHVAKTNNGTNTTQASAKTSSSGGGDGSSGIGSGKSDSATANYYGNMLHDRFYRAWEQPQTVVATGVKLSAIARIRIEKDGRVSDFKIVKPSGNVLVDESVQSAGGKVTQVDALPAGMASGGHYDVNINFALNSE